MNMTRIHTFFPPVLLRRVDQYAKDQGICRAEAIRKICAEFFVPKPTMQDTNYQQILRLLKERRALQSNVIDIEMVMDRIEKILQKNNQRLDLGSLGSRVKGLLAEGPLNVTQIAERLREDPQAVFLTLNTLKMKGEVDLNKKEMVWYGY